MNTNWSRFLDTELLAVVDDVALLTPPAVLALAAGDRASMLVLTAVCDNSAVFDNSGGGPWRWAHGVAAPTGVDHDDGVRESGAAVGQLQRGAQVFVLLRAEGVTIVNGRVRRDR